MFLDFGFPRKLVMFYVFGLWAFFYKLVYVFMFWAWAFL